MPRVSCLKNYFKCKAGVTFRFCILSADTTPPKKQIKEMSQDFYSAGFIPGAIVYFAYDLPKGQLLLCFLVWILFLKKAVSCVL